MNKTKSNKSLTTLERNKEKLIEALKSAEIERVTVNYGGSGDNGSVDDPKFFARGDIPIDSDDSMLEGLKIHEVEIPQNPKWDNGKWVPQDYKLETLSLSEAVNQLCCDTLDEVRGGWENDNGAEGTFEILVGENKIFWEHTYFYQESNTETLEL